MLEVGSFVQSICSDTNLFASDASLLEEPDRVVLSAGTMPAASSEELDGYVENARIPNPFWRAPTLTERSLLMTMSSPDDRRFVAILKVFGKQMLDRLAPSVNSLWLMSRDDQRVESHPVTTALLESLRLQVRFSGKLQFTGVTFDPPGLNTVSIDSRHKLVGLHVDYWDKKPLAERCLSPSRLCVNIGTENRHFIYMNVGIDKMAELLRKVRADVSEEPAYIARQFMISFPDYPVIKLLVKPGEAYIAPTELLVHDASSSDAKTRTRHVAFRGSFNLST